MTACHQLTSGLKSDRVRAFLGAAPCDTSITKNGLMEWRRTDRRSQYRTPDAMTLTPIDPFFLPCCSAWLSCWQPKALMQVALEQAQDGAPVQPHHSGAKALLSSSKLLFIRADPADIDHAGGCPGPESGRDAECCTEYGFCHPRVRPTSHPSIYCTDQQGSGRTQQCAARKKPPDTISC